MIKKFASAAILDARMGETTGFAKGAHRAVFNYTPREGYLYVRSRAISSRCNDNFDMFPAKEIEASYKSFIGKPVFVNHHNEDHRRARGVIIDAALHRDRNPDGSPDTWVEVLHEVDAVKFPKLAKAILAGEVDRTSMGCFLGDTLITTSDGTVKRIDEIKLGDLILTHTGRIEPVTYVMEREYEGTTYSVHTYGQGRPVTATEEHPFWIKRGDSNSTWIEARDIQVGDWVLTPTNRETVSDGSWRLATLLGYYLAEGNLLWDRNRRGYENLPVSVEWNFHENELEYIEDVRSSLLYFGYTPTKVYTKRGTKGVSIRCNNPRLALQLMGLGGHRCDEKQLAPQVMKWEIAHQRRLLECYFNGDGCYREECVEVGTASEQLAHQIHAIALRTGLWMTPPVKQYSTSAQHKRPKWSLQAKLTPTINKDGSRRVQGHFVDASGSWRRVTKIESASYSGPVYNFDVKGDDSYVAGDIAVHNCDVQFSKCSACGNVATSPLEYCFLPGTLITMANGTLKSIENIKSGDRVLTHDGPGIVKESMVRDYHGPLSSIKRTGYGAPLVSTHGHDILANRRGRRNEEKSSARRYESVIDPNNWEWTASEKLDPGHWVQGAYPTEELTVSVKISLLAADLLVRDDRTRLGSTYRSGSRRGNVNWGRNSFPLTVDNTDPYLGFIVGLFAAEGSFEGRTNVGTPKLVCWSLGSHEIDIVQDLQLALDKYGAGKLKIYRKTDTNGICVKLSNAPLAQLLQHWVGRGAKDKHLHGDVMLAPQSFQRAFLDAYYRGDGWDDPRGHVEVRTAGEFLARQLFMMGSRVETMIPSWSVNRKNSGGPTYRNKTFVSHHLSMGRQNAMKGRRRLNDGYFANKIIDTATINHYVGPVYNFEVEEKHSYVAEGVVVHNCAHIPGKKGKKIVKVNPDGTREARLIFEICSGLSFFENSLLVEQPADPTAYALGEIVAGSGLDHMRPSDPSSYLTNEAGGYSVPIANRLISSSSERFSTTASRDLVSQFSDISDVVFAQPSDGVGYPLQTASSDDHISRVVSVRPQHPMSRVVAQRNVANMPYDKTFGNGSNEVGVAPTMGSNRSSFSVAQTQSSVARVKDATRPKPTFVDSSSVNFGQIPIHDSHVNDYIKETPQWQRTASRTMNNSNSIWNLIKQATRPTPVWSLIAEADRIGDDLDNDLQVTAATQGQTDAWHQAFAAHPRNIVNLFHYAHDSKHFDTKSEPPSDPNIVHNGLHWYEGMHHVGNAIAAASHPSIGLNKEGHHDPELARNRTFGAMAIYSEGTDVPMNYHQASLSTRTGHAIWAKDTGMSREDQSREFGLVKNPQTKSMDPGKPKSMESQADKISQLYLPSTTHFNSVVKAPKTNNYGHLGYHGGDEPGTKHGIEAVHSGYGKGGRTVIDRHALSGAVGMRINGIDFNQAGLSDYKKSVNNPLAHQESVYGNDANKHYAHVADAYRVAAHHLSQHYGQNIHPHQVQAVAWAAQRHLNESGHLVHPPVAKGHDTWGKEDEKTWEGVTHAKHSWIHTPSGASPVDSGQRSFKDRPNDRNRNNWEQHLDRNPEVGNPVKEHFDGNQRGHWGSRHLAYGETKAPRDVDTLRAENCAVCFAPETLIRTDQGFVPIATVEVGDRVLSKDGKYRKVTAVHENQFDGALYSIQTRTTAEPIFVTAEHPFLTMVGTHSRQDAGDCSPTKCSRYGDRHLGGRWGNQEIVHTFGWVEASNLHVGSFLGINVPAESKSVDSVTVPLRHQSKFVKSSRKGPNSFELDDDFLWMIGLYLAEGSSGSRSLSFALHQKEVEFIDRLENLFSRLGYNSRVDTKDTSLGAWVNVHSTTLASWFPEWLGAGAANKAIPEELMALPLDRLCHVIQGVFDGDGTKQDRILRQTSERLALQVSEFLIRSGRPSSIMVEKSINKLPVYAVNMQQTERTTSRTWRVEDTALSQVTSVERLPYVGMVYNLSVEEDPSYTVQNILVHNCGNSTAFDGVQCQVCGYVAPPRPFGDPDTDTAKAQDMRKQVLDSEDNTADPNDPDQQLGNQIGDPNVLEDQADEAEEDGSVPPLSCTNCGTGIQPAPAVSAGGEPPYPAEGDVCPVCKKGELTADGGDEADEDEDGDGIPDDEEEPTDDPEADDDAEEGEEDPDEESDNDDDDDKGSNPFKKKEK